MKYFRICLSMDIGNKNFGKGCNGIFLMHTHLRSRWRLSSSDNEGKGQIPQIKRLINDSISNNKCK